MLITSYFIDNKIAKLTSGKTWFYRLVRWVNAVYRPVARLRLERGWARGLFEYWVYQQATRIFASIQNRLANKLPQT